MYTLIGTAKLNEIAPQAWLIDVLVGSPIVLCIVSDKLLPWNWAID
jgi:hypothetical protein